MRGILTLGAILGALMGCATGNTETDARRTESAVRVCNLTCAAAANEAARRCRTEHIKQPDDYLTSEDYRACDERMSLGSIACRETCDSIEIDGKLGGIDVID